MENFIERFSPTTTSIGSSSYLVLDLSLDEKIERFQVEMIANNKISGILPIDLRQRDDSISLYYNVTSKQPLSLVFSRKKFSRDEFITFLINMIDGIDSCSKYLLSSERFLLDENYIYLDPSTLETHLLYLPLQVVTSNHKNIRDFINKLILEIANLDDKNTDNYLQRIINFMRNDENNLSNFKAFLNELKGEKAPQESAQQMFIQQRAEENIAPNKIEPVEIAPKKIEPKQIEPENISSSKHNIPKSNIPSGKAKTNKAKKPKATNAKKDKNIKKEKKVQSSSEYKTSTIIIAVLSQLLFVGVVIGFWDKLIDLSSGDMLNTVAGIIIVIGGVDYFLFKKLFSKENMVEKNIKTKKIKTNVPKEESPVNMNKREIRNIEEPRVYNEPVVNPQYAYNEPTSYAMDDNVDETTFIGDIAEEKRVFLQGTRNGILEEININKDSFIIGRVREQVDYVSDNTTIGKMHAEIIKREGNYYIRDLNSRNGTFLNNERLVGYQEYPLKNNDIITFSNSSFTFVIME